MGEGWQSATLAEKIPDPILRQGPKAVWSLIAKEAKDLHVDWEMSAPQQWLQIRARGDDAEVFLNLLKEKYGEAPTDRSKIERWDLRKGFITGAGRVGFGVYVDLGAAQPIKKDALYPLHRMRAQLSDGKPRSAREVLAEHALVDFFPVLAIVTDLQGENVTVELSDETREQFLTWKKLPFDRVIAIGVGRDEVEKAIQSAGLGLDVIKVETLSLLAQCLVCKMDTDAPGVIARIGKRLQRVGLTAFRTPFKPLR